MGAGLKAARKGRKLTLAQVSEQSGVSISTLSKIENGLVSPSFDIIKRICDTLDIALEGLMVHEPAPQEPQTLAQGRKTTTLSGAGASFTCGQYDYIAHATELFRKGMVPLEIFVRARSIDEFDHWSRHNGEEFVYVLSGEIEVHTELYAPFKLKAGESAYFDSTMGHVYISISENDAHVLSVSFDPKQGQKPIQVFMHADARPVEPAV